MISVEHPVRLIALVGFMGAGKTTVGRLLAAQTGWRFLDADAVIEAETGSTIAELFNRHGEPWFRELERRTIARLVSDHTARHMPTQSDAVPSMLPGLVLALGGGAIEDAETRALLLHADGVRLVHLEVTLAESVRRCTADAGNLRPVLADRERLATRYAQRLGLYRLAHRTVAVDGLTPEQAAEGILHGLREDAS